MTDSKWSKVVRNGRGRNGHQQRTHTTLPTARQLATQPAARQLATQLAARQPATQLAARQLATQPAARQPATLPTPQQTIHAPDKNTGLLAPIRTVQDTVTGSEVYTMDPFCPSNIEFQRRAEDELTKFIYKIVKSASNKGISIKYKVQKMVRDTNDDWETGYKDVEADKALEDAALDFRWLMKHLKHNSVPYCRCVFTGLGVYELGESANRLKDDADLVAHKQYLKDNLRGNGKTERRIGTSAATSERINRMIQFADSLSKLQSCFVVPDLDIHRQNLKAIKEAHTDLWSYQIKFKQNAAAFEKMTEGKQLGTTIKVLGHITEQCCSGDNKTDAQKVVTAQLASRFSLTASDFSS